MKRFRDFVLETIGESIKEKAFFFCSLLFLLLICVTFVYQVWLTSVESTEAEALKLASVAEASLVNENIKSLEGNEKDLMKWVYIETKNILEEIVKAHQNIRFAYFFLEKDGHIVFAVDNEPPQSEDYSPPGQKYTEASPQVYQAFVDGKPFVEKNTDRWGTWVSVMIPMIDETTGNVIAIFGVDYTVSMWYQSAVRHTVQAGAVAFCIVIAYLCILTVVRTSLNLAKEKRKLSDVNEKLFKEEELFRTVFEQSPVGISISAGGVITYNNMYEKIVGRTGEEINKIGWEAITYPDDLEQELKLFNQFTAEKSSYYEMNKRYVKPDGSTVWANITVAPIWVNSNSDQNHICIIEDITERIKAEKDLMASERSYEVLLSNLPGMAYRCKYDREWTMQFASHGCFELTGYPSSSLINNKDISYNDLIGPKYQEDLWTEWTRVINEKAKLAEEYEIVTASGETKWVFEQGQAIYDELGNVEELEGLIIDISDRKRKEDEILFLNNHDYLTGTYNRHYFELEKNRLSQERFLPLSVIMGDINGVKLVNDAFGHTEGDILIKETAKIMQACCRELDVVARIGGDEFMMLMPLTDPKAASDMIGRIRNSCEIYNRHLSNEAYSINISLGFETKETNETGIDETIKQAEDYMCKRKLLEHKSSHSVILQSIKATMHERSHETQEHAERLTNLSKELGKKLNLSQPEMDELVLVATLHDIGKVGIDDRILNKPGKLNEEEWKEMKKHSEIGYRIAMSSPDLVPIADLILSLHERWDGNGYPQGLKEEEIPLLSRIVSVVDAYDAMTEDRAYRKAMSSEEAVMELKKNAGIQFDPEIVNQFLNKILPYCRME